MQNRTSWTLLVFVSVATIFVNAGRADEITTVPPAVIGLDRVAGDQPEAQVLKGLVLIGELGCSNCHAPSALAATHLQTRRAPLLEGVGRRLRNEHILEWLDKPADVKPGTTMPEVFAGMEPAVRAQNRLALAHFLAGADRPSLANAADQAIARGESLYHSIGCAVCHGSLRQGAARNAPGSVPLGQLDKKYTVPSLTQFLLDPLAIRPSARMPHFHLQPQEAQDLASYLCPDQSVEPNLNFEYFEGDWDRLPNFDKLQPQKSGRVTGFDLSVGRKDRFAIRFSGYLQVVEAGNYTIHLGSDDGSRLWLDGKEIVTVDGVHPLTYGVGRVALTAGAHPLAVEYFEGGGEQELRIEIEGQGTGRRPLANEVTPTEVPPPPSREATVDPALAKAGKEIYDRSGCKSCHQPESTSAVATPLNRLRSQRGCLADHVVAPIPKFSLSKSQISYIQAALEFLKEPDLAAANAEEVIRRTLVTFNCVTCHQRGEFGEMSESQNALFTTTQPEMGDEGRLPPSLNGIGAKLREDWLRHIFDHGGTDRPYMRVRMPRFGLNNIGQLIPAFLATDASASSRQIKTDFTDKQLKAAGRQMAGAQGFSCIKCHNWGGIPATGIQAMSLTTMYRRLREPWLHQYLLDPQSYRQGTRMPASWPNGQVLLPKLLDGNADTQIHALIRFLSDGDQASMPAGLGRDPIELVADLEPVIYRNFIEGAGTRAIGVGYPEKLNLAFDANDLRLALIWQGAFIDAARHWTDRGAGFQGPLGDNVLQFPPGPQLAPLTHPDSVWPTESSRTLGYRFRGYHFDQQRRPIFVYTHGDLKFEDALEPIASAEQFALQRSIHVHGTADGWYFRAATGRSIVALEDGWFRINDEWNTRLQHLNDIPAVPLIRQAGDLQELLLSIPRGSGGLRQVIQW